MSKVCAGQWRGIRTASNRVSIFIRLHKLETFQFCTESSGSSIAAAFALAQEVQAGTRVDASVWYTGDFLDGVRRLMHIRGALNLP